jgi:abnormal spindle-like microcephaly-associated protein
MLFGTGLRGEGNILHHLRPCGYRLTYVQSKLHEFDFAVHSLAADLGDGMRLCKLAEKLTGARGCKATKSS